MKLTNFESKRDKRLAKAAEKLLAACEAFVGYYEQAGISDDSIADDDDDQFSGDEKFNVRLARRAIALARGESK